MSRPAFEGTIGSIDRDHHTVVATDHLSVPREAEVKAILVGPPDLLSAQEKHFTLATPDQTPMGEYRTKDSGGYVALRTAMARVSAELHHYRHPSLEPSSQSPFG